MQTKDIAPLVDALFKTHLTDDGREYAYQEVAREIRRRFGGDIHPSYIGKLRKGEIPNPGREALMHLCLFFRVPASYFFPELDDLNPPEDASADPRETLRAALRSTGIDASAQAHIEGLVAALTKRA